MLLVAGLVALFCFFTVYYLFIYPGWVSPLSSIPSIHFSAPFTSLWIDWQRFRGQDFYQIHAAFHKHGPYVRLGPKDIAINDVDGGYRKIYGFGQDNLDKPSWYDYFMNFGSRNTFCSLNASEHALRRHRVSSVYAKSFFQQSPDVRQILEIVLSDRLLPHLRFSAENHAPLDAMGLSLAYGLDIMSAVAYGFSHGTDFIDDKEARDEWLDLCRQKFSASAMFWHQEHPQLARFFRILRFDVVPRSHYEAVERLEMWAARRAALAEEALQDHDELASPFLYGQMRSSLARENGVPSEKRFRPTRSQHLYMAGECLDHLIATRDTLGPTLCFTIYQLSLHPEAQSRLRAELHSIPDKFSSSTATQIPRKLPSSASLESLPFLQAVMLESVRLRNNFPTPNPRVTSHRSASTNIGPCKRLPGGVRISAYTWSLHRDKAIWGPNAEQWRPERWLDPKGEGDGSLVRNFWGFGGGRRGCLGKELGLEMIRYGLAAIYTTFTTSIVSEEKYGDKSDGFGFLTGKADEELLVNIEVAVD